LRSAAAVRAILVVALLALQSADLSDSFGLFTQTALWLVPPAAMIALFALAGFGLARGIDRNSWRPELQRTAWQSFPAVVVVIVLTVLVVGAVSTQQRLGLYFSDGETWLYFLNIVGIPRFSLPGVFASNNVPGMVNANVWILPVAFGAAAITVAASLLPARTTAVLVGGAVAGVVFGIVLQSDSLAVPYARTLARIWTGSALNASFGFLLGALAYHQRARLVIDWRIGGLVMLALMTGAAIGDRRMFQGAIAGPIMAAAIAYLALVACSLPLPFRHAVKNIEPVLLRVLLLSYPVQQFWIDAGSGRQSGVLNLAVSVPTIIALACAEWFCLERPLLRRLGRDFDSVDGGDHSPFGGIAARPRRSVKDRAASAIPALVSSLVIIGCALVAIALAVFALQRDTGG
jgi:peptidoglycan/LPS O-acetylase OafA/YrhL